MDLEKLLQRKQSLSDQIRSVQYELFQLNSQVQIKSNLLTELNFRLREIMDTIDEEQNILSTSKKSSAVGE